MKTTKSALLLAFSASLLSIVPDSLVAQKLDEKTFQKLHKNLQCSPDELWRTIPWKISLLDAQKTAATERKPIFIWAMDGHPLGCT